MKKAKVKPQPKPQPKPAKILKVKKIDQTPKNDKILRTVTDLEIFAQQFKHGTYIINKATQEQEREPATREDLILICLENNTADKKTVTNYTDEELISALKTL